MSPRTVKIGGGLRARHANTAHLASYTGNITPPPDLAIFGSPDPTGMLGDDYLFLPTTLGGVGGNVVTLRPGGTKPPDVDLDPDTGELSGFLGAIGTFSGELRVTDADGNFADLPFSIAVSVPALTVSLPVTGATALDLTDQLAAHPPTTEALINVSNPVGSTLDLRYVA